MNRPKVVLTRNRNGKYIVLKGRDILERAMAAAEKASTTGERVPLRSRGASRCSRGFAHRQNQCSLKELLLMRNCTDKAGISASGGWNWPSREQWVHPPYQSHRADLGVLAAR